MTLGIDSTQSDQMIRGSVSLPHGVGKTVRVVVFCQGDNVAKAKEAGADFAGADDLIEKIQSEGWTRFRRGPGHAGPDGQGQPPRQGARPARPDADAQGRHRHHRRPATWPPPSREFKAGKVEYRADKGGNVHAGVGKMSFDDDKLADNVTAFVEQVRAVKPSGVKGHYIQSITLAGTMTPGIPARCDVEAQ